MSWLTDSKWLQYYQTQLAAGYTPAQIEAAIAHYSQQQSTSTNDTPSLDWLPHTGNMLLNGIVYQNILTSSFYNDVLDNVHSIDMWVAEVERTVRYLAPFASGTTPSSAYCLLLRLSALMPNATDMQRMLRYKDCVYVRGLALLLLRYLCRPALLLDWFRPYLSDVQQLVYEHAQQPQMRTIGHLCHVLLQEQKFEGTILPRIPVPVATKIKELLGGTNEPAVTTNLASSSTNKKDKHAKYANMLAVVQKKRRRSPSPSRATS